ncbi:hypothetical protein B0T19DRAFT_232001 [Cercophora scortea]|uniref:Uncharacterized protein n=1 Tax=Cercophora scortea TaxID=314031 RepID=A0AAE0IGE2_9PEZI|nr:hypothetical protein B0T19DRAFT_232001 [Cercophora scortea]
MGRTFSLSMRSSKKDPSEAGKVTPLGPSILLDKDLPPSPNPLESTTSVRSATGSQASSQKWQTTPKQHTPGSASLDLEPLPIYSSMQSSGLLQPLPSPVNTPPNVLSPPPSHDPGQHTQYVAEVHGSTASEMHRLNPQAALQSSPYAGASYSMYQPAPPQQSYQEPIPETDQEDQAGDLILQGCHVQFPDSTYIIKTGGEVDGSPSAMEPNNQATMGQGSGVELSGVHDTTRLPELSASPRPSYNRTDFGGQAHPAWDSRRPVPVPVPPASAPTSPPVQAQAAPQASWNGQYITPQTLAHPLPLTPRATREPPHDGQPSFQQHLVSTRYSSIQRNAAAAGPAGALENSVAAVNSLVDHEENKRRQQWPGDGQAHLGYPGPQAPNHPMAARAYGVEPLRPSSTPPRPENGHAGTGGSRQGSGDTGSRARNTAMNSTSRDGTSHAAQNATSDQMRVDPEVRRVDSGSGQQIRPPNGQNDMNRLQKARPEAEPLQFVMPPPAPPRGASASWTKLRDKVTGRGSQSGENERSSPIVVFPNHAHGQGSIDQRVMDFVAEQKIPLIKGVDPLSNIFIYFPQKLAQLEKQLEDQGTQMQSLRESMQREISNLKREKAELEKRKESWKASATKTQNDLELSKGLAAKLRGDCERLTANLAATEANLGEFQRAWDQQMIYHKQFEQDLQALEEQNRIGELQRQQLQAEKLDEFNRLMYERERDMDAMQREMERLRSDYEDKLANQNRTLQEEIKEYKVRIASYSHGSSAAISDQTFHITLESVAQKLSNIASYVPRPENHLFDSDLDPTNFLGRNSQQGSRVWPRFVRSVCWSVILRGFFQYPLGFGVFGTQGDGYFHLSYLYEDYAVQSPNDPGTLCIPNDKKTNEGRGFRFEKILDKIKDPADSSRDKQSVIYFRANVDQVTQDLVHALQRCSNMQLDARAPAQIATVVHDVGILALEMGSQRAHIMMESCSYGARITPGDKFKDESESSGGSDVQVDLMTQPCMVRIGDGREDLTSFKVISMGNVIALKPGY